MAFRSGALSVRRFVVEGDVPEALARTATMAVRRYAWKPVDADRGEREAFGWVNPRNVLQEQLDWEDLVDGHLAIMGVRRDRKSFNKTLYKARREELFEKTRREKSVERLTRQHRLALEEELTVRMLKEVTPTTAFTELVWDMNAGEVYVAATSKALCERIADLFMGTFDLRLLPRFPALAGLAFIEEQGLEEDFARATALAAGKGEAG